MKNYPLESQAVGGSIAATWERQKLGNFRIEPGIELDLPKFSRGHLHEFHICQAS